MKLTRAQRRRLEKANRKQKIQSIEPDFSGESLVTICESIMLLIRELDNRGVHLNDFDNKDKYIQAIQIIKDKPYFMAAGDEQ